MSASDRDLKRVLVGVEGINRPVAYSGTNKDLESAIVEAFRDRLCKDTWADKELVVEIRDEEWNGAFVQLIDQEVADRSVLRARVIDKCKTCTRTPTPQAVSWTLRG